jgi:serine-type D-Ala-D-Ala carboxypeptidase (penicillin-binding protein 5/6)
MSVYLICFGKKLKTNKEADILFKKILILLVVILMPYIVYAAEFPNEDSSKSYILMDCNTGEVLLESNSAKTLQVAGITRSMTLLIAFEEIEKNSLKLDEKITVSKNAASMGGTQVFLRENKSYTVDMLIKSVIIASANDACFALSERISADHEKFVEKMNDRAKKLNLSNTVFTNATGIYDENQTTCAADMAIVARKLLKYDLFFKYSDTYIENFVHEDGKTTEMINSNRLIRFYDGADGIATGSSKEAGYCLMATAKKGQSRFIFVSLGDKNSKERFDQAIKMLDYGFNNFMVKRIVKQNQIVKKQVDIINGEKKTINLYAKDDLNVIFEKSMEHDIKSHVEIYEDLQAPIEKGQECGKIIVKIDGKVVNSVSLIAGEDVAMRTFNVMLSKIFNAWIMK